MISHIKIWHLLGVLLLFSSAASAASFIRSDTGSSFDPQNFHHEITQTGAIGYFEDGEIFSFHDFEIKALQSTVVYFSQSSEFFSSAVLKGKIQDTTNRKKAKTGDILTFNLNQQIVQKFQFDIERFLGSSSLIIDENIRKTLSKKSRKQSRQKYFGTLRPAGVNAQAPISPAIEATKRDYLLNDAVTTIKQNPCESWEKAVKTTYQKALKEKDFQTIGSLLHPKTFVEQDTAQYRETFAKKYFGSLNRASIITSEYDGFPFIQVSQSQIKNFSKPYQSRNQKTIPFLNLHKNFKVIDLNKLSNLKINSIKIYGLTFLMGRLLK
ncbi:MAG: hypothetical protein AAF549_05040 [Pseudomonadota bacterium]